MMGVLGERVEREQKSHENNAADEDVEEDGEGAGFDGGVEAGSFRQGELPQACPEGDGGSDGGHPAEHATRQCGRQRGVDEHDGDAGQREDDLGEDAVDVGNWIHRWLSPVVGSALILSCVDDCAGDCWSVCCEGGCCEVSWGGCTPVRMLLSQRFGARPITSMRMTSGVRIASSPKRRSLAGFDAVSVDSGP